MSPQATVRAQARLALKGNYAKACIAFAVALLPIYILDGAAAIIACGINVFVADDKLAEALFTISVITSIAVIGVLISPLVNGYIKMFYNNALKHSMDLNDLYHYFSKGRYVRALKLNLSFILRMFIPAVLFFLPVMIYVGVCSSMDSDFTGSVIYRDFFFILSVLSSMMTVLYSLKYFTVFTVFSGNAEMTNKELFDMSKHLMRGQSARAAKLIFSYTPWMLLCFTVLPLIYVVPYMTQGLCIGARWMTEAALERREL